MNRLNLLSDSDILALFREDAERAFRAVYDKYYLQLTVFTVRLTDSFELSEDIVQDFFVVFWEKRYFLNIGDNLRGYLFRAVRNNALAELRRKGICSMEQLSDTYIDIPSSPYDLEELQQLYRRLMDDLEALPERERDSVKLVLLENKRYAQAADQLGISINTLKTHLSRALKTLKRKHNLMLLFF